MTRKKRTLVYVIAGRPLPLSGPGACCLDENGEPTETQTRWVYFYSFEEAQEWATENGIILDGAMRYVAPRDYIEGQGVV